MFSKGHYSIELKRDELNASFGGGVPKNSLVLFEGQDGAGKSILCQRFLYALLKNGVKVTYISTELNTLDFIKQTESVNYSIKKFMLNRQLLFITMLPYLGKVKFDEDFLEKIMNSEKIFENDVIIFDTLSFLLVKKNAEESVYYDIINFFRNLNNLNKTVIFTIDPTYLDEKFLTLLRSVADLFLTINIINFAGEIVRNIEVKDLKDRLIHVKTQFLSGLNQEKDLLLRLEVILKMVERRHYPKTEDFNQALAKYPHLKVYVDKISKDEGVPEFRTKLDKSLRDIRNPNFIYPVGDPIFIHISRGSNLEDAIKYKVLMPEMDDLEKEYYDAIVDRIIEVAHTARIPESLDELENILIDLFNQVTYVKHPPERPNFLNSLGKKITVTQAQHDKILFHLIKDRIGSGKLESTFRDIYIEDISCVGVGAVWLIHKVFGMLETNIIYEDDLELNKYVVESSERVERPVSEATPVVDAIMPDGSRVNYIYSRKISLGGSSFTIRKFNENPISAPMLINWGTWSSQLGAYLWLCCENGISIFVCGETASGKTTTLNAMTTFIPMDHKVYTVENTPEVTLPHPVWQHLVTRESGEKTDVTMFGLLLAALRSRPDYIIVGEIRGQEASVTFQAMQTGHPAISTFHAGSVHSMIQRLTGDPINIPIAFIDCLNVALIQSAVYVRGRVERRVLSVTEILRYNDEVGKVLTKEVFHWDSAKDVHQFRGLYNSFILEEKVANHLGLQDSKEIYNIMNKRAKILEKLIEHKIMDYFEVVELMKNYRNNGETVLPFKL